MFSFNINVDLLWNIFWITQKKSQQYFLFYECMGFMKLYLWLLGITRLFSPSYRMNLEWNYVILGSCPHWPLGHGKRNVTSTDTASFGLTAVRQQKLRSNFRKLAGCIVRHGSTLYWSFTLFGLLVFKLQEILHYSAISYTAVTMVDGIINNRIESGMHDNNMTQAVKRSR